MKLTAWVDEEEEKSASVSKRQQSAQSRPSMRAHTRRLLLTALLLCVSLLNLSQGLRSRRGTNIRFFLALLRQNLQRRADVRSLTRVLVDLSLLLLHNRRLVFFVLFSIRRRPRDSCRLLSLPEQRLYLRVEE